MFLEIKIWRSRSLGLVYDVVWLDTYKVMDEKVFEIPHAIYNVLGIEKAVFLRRRLQLLT